MSLKIQFGFQIPRNFFPKVIWGLPIKVPGNKITGNKDLKKKVLSPGKMMSIFRRFHKVDILLCIWIFNIARGIFNAMSLFFYGYKHPLFQSIFHSERTFFLGKIILKPEKKSQKINSQNGRTLFPEIFLFRGLFFTGPFQNQNLGL